MAILGTRVERKNDGSDKILTGEIAEPTDREQSIPHRYFDVFVAWDNGERVWLDWRNLQFDIE